jgi:hypothetical protein
MIWMDYNIEQCGNSFTIKGDWPGEVWQDKEGNPKPHALYKPGDVFVVDENGWLRKTDQLSTLLMKYEEGKKHGNRSSESN